VFFYRPKPKVAFDLLREGPMRPVISGLCFLAAAAAFTAPAFAEGIAVPMDELRIVP
jgi:hypothetical protein